MCTSTKEKNPSLRTLLSNFNMDIKFLFFFTIACLLMRCFAQTSVKEVHIPGDFVLGALFPIHGSKDGTCTSRINEQDHWRIQRGGSGDQLLRINRSMLLLASTLSRKVSDIMRSMDWQYASILYEDSNYGIDGYTEIKAAAENAGICFGFEEKVKESAEKDELQRIADNLMKRRNSEGKVVAILFTQYNLAHRIMEIVDQSFNSNDIVWIGCDAWIGKEPPSGHKESIEGAIGISPETGRYPGFDKYFKNISLGNSSNPWFGEYLRQRYNCSLIDGVNGCSKIEIEDFRELLTVYNVRNAVYAFGSALETLHSLLCGGNVGVCEDMKANLSGDLLHKYLSNVSNPFNTSFHFVNGRDGPTRYSVLQYQRQQNDLEWRENGTYSGKELIWKTMNGSQFSSSVCSLPCKKGQFRSRGEVCCWKCKDCDYTEIVNASDPYNCQTCDIHSGWTSNPSQNVCVAIPVDHLHYDSPFILVIFVLSTLGVIICCVVSIVFILKRTTPIVKATGFETSIVLLVGILFSYLSPFILVIDTTVASCAFFREFLGLSYTMAYSSIFSKLMVYNRAFDIKSSLKTKPIQGQTVFNRNICTIKTALVISLTLSAVHFLALVFWSIGDTPSPVVKYSVTHEEAIGNFSYNDLDNFSYFVSLGYSFLLMIACLVFAIKTRKLPDGMNDSHEIMYCSLTSFILWIAFIPLYALSESKLIKVMSLSISLIIHGTTCLICLFIPKIYIVIFRPEKNNKERVMRSTPSRSRNSYSGSFLGSRAFDKKQSTALTLEMKESTNCKVKPSSTSAADDTTEGREDYFAMKGNLPFEKFNVSEGPGNKEELDNIKSDKMMTKHKVSDNITPIDKTLHEGKDAEISNQDKFSKSIGFKISSLMKHIKLSGSQEVPVSTVEITDEKKNTSEATH
ncbi:metabotropic glutamate receptor 6-like [Saccostrea cucullata]|uniref:metabotropic glutamate receptor 6-like n=1 Tax=Saccostrea cuccullata TaxID=36930 RepID=UPI002ED1CA3E